jgi:hypothetical protein
MFRAIAALARTRPDLAACKSAAAPFGAAFLLEITMTTWDRFMKAIEDGDPG